MCENMYDGDTWDTPPSERKKKTMEEYCNGCGNVICNMVKSSNGERFNWYCEINNSEWRSLEISAPKGTLVVKPHWCPKAMKNSGESATRTTSTTNKPLTPESAMADVKPITPWESIKVNQIYHLPPMFNLPRRDILIKSINKTCLNYVILEHGKTAGNAQHVLYPSMQLAKFIVPHKNLKVELVHQNPYL